MKTLLNYLILFILLLIVFSCKQNNVNVIQPNDMLIGTWVFSSYENETITMLKADSLEKDSAGYIFYVNSSLVERKNSGWCGTPPIAYGNFNGSWQRISDSTINVNVGYWGGNESYKIVISMLNKDTLKFKKIYS